MHPFKQKISHIACIHMAFRRCELINEISRCPFEQKRSYIANIYAISLRCELMHEFLDKKFKKKICCIQRSCRVFPLCGFVCAPLNSSLLRKTTHNTNINIFFLLYAIFHELSMYPFKKKISYIACINAVFLRCELIYAFSIHSYKQKTNYIAHMNVISLHYYALMHALLNNN